MCRPKGGTPGLGVSSTIINHICGYHQPYLCIYIYIYVCIYISREYKLPPPFNFTFNWEDDDDDDDDVDEMREKVRHPFAQTNDTGNLTKHWPCAVKTHFPGQHIRPGRIFIFVYIHIICIYILYVNIIYIYMYTCGMHICIHTYARPNIGMSSICFAFLHKTHAHTHTLNFTVTKIPGLIGQSCQRQEEILCHQGLGLSDWGRSRLIHFRRSKACKARVQE